MPRYLGAALLQPFLLTRPRPRARSPPIYLASAPEVEGVTGQYVANRKPRLIGEVIGRDR